jgi:hypothetical protein
MAAMVRRVQSRYQAASAPAMWISPGFVADGIVTGDEFQYWFKAGATRPPRQPGRPP